MAHKRSRMCPHIGSHHVLEIKKLEKVKTCADCDYSGPNLWICLQKNCLRVGCSEQANDHSTEHFQLNNCHCLHMNMSSQRLWCYLCEREIFIDVKPTLIEDPFIKAIRSAVALPRDENDNSDGNVEEGEDNQEMSNISTGLVGLQNIANTCYMNAALQALSNVQPMTHYFLNCNDLVDHIVEQSSIRNKVGLAKSYQRLMNDIWCMDGVGKDYIAPRGILYGIRSVHPMFRGFQQHDTQEFLRCFMDQLHEELKENSPTLPIITSAEVALAEMHTSEEPLDTDSVSQSSSVSDSEYETCDSSLSQHSNQLKGQLHSGSTERSRRPRKTHTSASQPQAVVHSIISDIFDGKLLSSVQCLTCDRISTREETFQDLSLPIPNRDYLNMLHQTHSLSAQSLNSIDTLAPNNTDGWFSWFWKLFRSWLWGPSVTLYDCMSSFFSADELKGDNMYSCEKCNKLRTGIKYSQILELPEVLCIHLKRFRHDLSYSSKISSPVHFPLEGFDMKPYLHKDCKSTVTSYNLVSVICHHGTVGGGHYTCFARNPVTDRWYRYDDQHVTEVPPSAVQNCQAYVIFYRKHHPQMELIRAKASEISALNPVHTAEIRFFVAREWLTRFSTFAEPGPINNWTILCSHGGLLQSKMALLDQIAVPISQPLWDFLYCTFGGGPAINMLFECEICKRQAEALKRRQIYELCIFTKFTSMDVELDCGAIYAISMPWLRKWQQFARGATHKEPGPISNANIALITDAAQSSPLRQVRPGSDYAQVNAPLWRFFYGIYGGGPEIMLRGSVTEEIEIIDQDEQYDGDQLVDKLDLSDTESNIGNTNCFDLNESLTESMHENCISDNRSSENNTPSPTIRVPYGNHKESRHAKHFSGNGKKLRPPLLRNSLRKKTVRGRNAIKSAFGPTGNYNFRKSFDCIENVPEEKVHTHSTHTLDTESDVQQSAFSVNQKQSFPIDKKSRKSNSKQNYAESVASYSEEIVAVHAGHAKNRSKSKDLVTLQKFVQLPESSESTETDI
ncbi:ubiquitin carboxyl-terminal hydrolase 20 [Anastrepha ludens]|uniref:ubiquitin carboxyl-terminal hydrolase 20 n=1 Tax=Anastrepha ludens TaxID=28586 RepID=UPI0023AF8E85|nr:ubiquitin carboxyl-terminal hydrolase 20 [Anastrepha ludens]XP_053965865.1 ubiquitin carboxyl-terminal hydrolase 20 [Anastrepha ludens]